MRASAAAWIGLFGLLWACESGSDSQGTEPQPIPEWLEPDLGDPVAPPVVAEPDAAARPFVARADVEPAVEPVFIPLVDRSVSLKERFHTGQRIRRTARLQRAYRVQAQSGRAASVQGATERHRTYTVDVTDALGGQIIAATVNVESDVLRVVQTGDEPRATPASGSLEGLSFDCRLNAQAGFDCEVPVVDGRPMTVSEIGPQRPGSHPGHPATVGDNWEISGAEARHFLGTEGVDAVVTFTFDDAEATYQDQTCHHVSYTVVGTQPVRLSGRTLAADLTGSGELFHCRRANAIVYHREEREVIVRTTRRRPGGPPPMERIEHIVFEEETTIEAP